MRIVITSWGSYGDVYPYIGLALELQRRGHRPVLALPAVYRELVEREGIEFAAVRPDLPIHDRALVARVMDPARGPEVIYRELLVPHLADTHADLMNITRPTDVMVTHPATPAAVIVAAERRLRWASSVLAPMSLFSVSDPITPAPAPWIQPLLARSPLVSRGFLGLINRITAKWAEPVQRFRISRGLSRGANPIVAGQHSPRLVLAMFSRVLASRQPDWPASVRITGPSLYNGDPGSEQSGMAANLGKFLDAGAPPIVFTLGTSAVGVAGRFYDTSAEAVERLGLRGVLLVGPHADNRPSRLGPRIHVCEFASHAVLFARAAAVVHQGGAGTLHQALVSGRPMLVVPHSHDQPDNARRVAALGVARTLHPRQYTLRRLEPALREVLEPRFRMRAAGIAALVQDENGPRAAVEAIEQTFG
jgi:UDP:flavonoid glycosyltransferase YjiC (YdhE family)